MARRRDLPEPVLEIDLHGSTRERGLKRLADELWMARTRGLSPVLVITGRGLGAREGVSVLRDAVQRWLRSEDARRTGVRDWRPAPHGGAFWVRLGAPREDGDGPAG